MKKLVQYIEKILIYGILLLMSFILLLAFADVFFEIISRMFQKPYFIVDANSLMDLFSIFLVLLIGIELLETVKLYLKEDVVHVELVILVAIIALSRKVIIWDFNKFEVNEMLSLAAMVVALGVTYVLVKKSNLKVRLPRKNIPEN
ncbi:MAG: phosphate-starvation-inducible PsiE family protein [Prolixibacteraceae bacterium]|nr:phosphate-starvation-inducible PsiE family protein [Prolixibacteraceae bacterium]MBN2649848.1 phosphate-starvation-inducible PsiE family protein [Prolixibacteraceae bacterium]